MLSVLIPTLNEARNIAECLDSVAWADEVVVVDSGSRDGTIEAAQCRGATVVEFKWNGGFPKKKNWALENVSWKNEWVLILDADERITPELASEIQQALKYPLSDGFFVNRRFMFLGRWIKHCGYYPSWNLRLFRHELGRFERLHSGDTGSGDNEVHEHVVLSGTTGRLKNEMLHFAYPDIFNWIEKHNRYSNWEAVVEAETRQRVDHREQGKDKRQQRTGGIGEHLEKRRRLRRWSRLLPFRPTLRFLYSFVLKRGFLDGYEGYMFCRLLASYEMMNVFKARELRRRRTN